MLAKDMFQIFRSHSSKFKIFLLLNFLEDARKTPWLPQSNHL